MSPIKTGRHLLSLVPEPVTAPATVRHAVNIVHKINPGQISVITGDPPVYAIEKQLQWIFPTEFKGIVWVFGPLHIKQVFIKRIRDWIENNGWTDVYGYTSIPPR